MIQFAQLFCQIIAHTVFGVPNKVPSNNHEMVLENTNSLQK